MKLLLGVFFMLLFAATAGAQETGGRYAPGAGVCMSGGVISACLPFKGPTGASYAILATDNAFRIKIDRNGATIPRAGVPTGFPANWQIEIINSDSVAAPLTTTVSIFKGAYNASAIILAPGATAFLQSDGTDYQTKLTEYVGVAPHTWTKQNSLPPCPLTDAATIAIDATSCAAGSTYGVGLFTVTLSGNGHNVPLPAGLVDGQTFGLRFTQGTTGSFSVNFASGYKFPGGTQVTLSTATGSVDEIWCHGFGGSSPSFASTEADCGQTLSAIGRGIVVRTNHAIGPACLSTTTCTVPITNSQLGDLRIIFLYWNVPTGAPVVGDIVSLTDDHGNSCTRSSGAFGVIGSAASDIWYCPIATAAATSTVTVTWGANIPNTDRMLAVEVSGAAPSLPDAGISSASTGTGSALSVTTNGVLPQAGDFVIAGFKSGGGAGGTISVGTGLTIIDQSDPGSPQATVYQIPASSGSAATISATTGGVQGWVGSIAAFKHQ